MDRVRRARARAGRAGRHAAAWSALKFLAIFTSNLDEFFIIRVAGLHDQVDAGLTTPVPTGARPSQVIDELRERILGLDRAPDALLAGRAAPGAGRARHPHRRDGRGRRRRAQRARRALPAPDLPGPHAAGGRSRPPVPLHLQPVAVARRPRARPADAGDDLRAREGAQGDAAALRARGRGHRPSSRSRSSSPANLDALFPGMEIVDHGFFRVTRDADFDISDEADDLLRAVEAELRRRRFGEVVRLEVDSAMSAALRARAHRGARGRGAPGLRHRAGCSTSPTCGRSSSCPASATCATRRGRR